MVGLTLPLRHAQLHNTTAAQRADVPSSVADDTSATCAGTQDGDDEGRSLATALDPDLAAFDMCTLTGGARRPPLQPLSPEQQRDAQLELLARSKLGRECKDGAPCAFSWHGVCSRRSVHDALMQLCQ